MNILSWGRIVAAADLKVTRLISSLRLRGEFHIFPLFCQRWTLDILVCFLCCKYSDSGETVLPNKVKGRWESWLLIRSMLIWNDNERLLQSVIFLKNYLALIAHHLFNWSTSFFFITHGVLFFLAELTRTGSSLNRYSALQSTPSPQPSTTPPQNPDFDSRRTLGRWGNGKTYYLSVNTVFNY